MAIRSFLAFELPVEIKKTVSLVSGKMRESRLDVRWVRLNRIHLTVVFLGNVLEENLERIATQVGRACKLYGKVDVRLNGAGVFPNRRRPNVLWLGLAGDVERLGRLRDDLQTPLASFGVKLERRAFKPHLTLGRFRRGGKPGPDLDALLEEHRDLESPWGTLSELVLFKSDLKSSGAVYTKLNAWPLTGER
jgi:2'-5' RNA ligase